MKYRPTTETVPCVPLYGVTDPARDIVEFFGTGTLLHYRGRYIIATAAHVIERDQKFILLVAGPESPLVLNGAAQVTPVRSGKTRNTDPLDFCAIDLSPENVAALSSRCHFIDLEADGVWDIPTIPFPHKIMGYPEDGNLPPPDKKTLPANGLRIDLMEDREIIQHGPDSDYREHPTWYIGLRYDPRNVEPQGRQPKVTTLHCFSGGAIWRTTGSHLIGFAGIVTESLEPRRTGERLVYGVRSRAIRDLLTTWNIPVTR
jgi:hypothetical protein